MIRDIRLACLAAGVGAGLAFCITASPVLAADLNGYKSEGYRGDRYGAGPYDDARYGHLYGRDRKLRCPPAHVVKRRFAEDGWSTFRDAREVDDDLVEVNARHEGGGVYKLTVEKCSGRIVDARLLRGPRFRDGPRDFDRYAWRPGYDSYAWRRPGRWWRDRY